MASSQDTQFPTLIHPTKLNHINFPYRISSNSIFTVNLTAHFQVPVTHLHEEFIS